MKVTICMGSKCTLMGANSIYDAVELIRESICGPESELCSAENLEIELSHCLDYCKNKESGQVAPVVLIDDEIIFKATAQEVSEKIINKLKI
ncbi:NAD(P)H-dependent oxidoreductase subunit E [Peptoniphilus stercorisuis]|uniref:NADH:ubiquinone oxidoreductase subunit E n=1 Tax=Peptoniphilus stercorisuis TaxID=1436965 RepID=A0ABS4KFF1_9FIRM|nr:NAD(P)H-dependent oxidoreductase subunit E [Peptoniphilus stercorisuis]MBP2025986.1 NADH:ubiquinone oxidoreductase subunit E [Peptoniphilus stercorisuis]